MRRGARSLPSARFLAGMSIWFLRPLSGKPVMPRSPRKSLKMFSCYWREKHRGWPDLRPLRAGSFAQPFWKRRRVSAPKLRRRQREETASEILTLQREGASPFAALLPLLDEALLDLRESERLALVLRFLENRSLREVGAALGVHEDAARKRVSRALEKSKRILSQARFCGFVCGRRLSFAFFNRSSGSAVKYRGVCRQCPRPSRLAKHRKRTQFFSASSYEIDKDTNDCRVPSRGRRAAGLAAILTKRRSQGIQSDGQRPDCGSSAAGRESRVRGSRRH